MKMPWKLRAIMADRNLSIRALSQETGFHQNTIVKWRKADTLPKINSDELERLARGVNCTQLALMDQAPIDDKYSEESV